ncbi:hypothetical protein [Streptomyces cacaoi]|uniref:Phage head morphogenesis domain-containing protein n=1 Tax=Streptomyces cacaoi TaxID=1898 RepID=A0A4Y3QZM4_STRCI|nr:hypothetical protein [Streptomyces cacaoi]GEB50439.1 hypothetical protein SCA03_29900 [Streptomyces cacaoi]
MSQPRDKVTDLYMQAQAALGAKAVEKTLSMWDEVTPALLLGDPSPWLKRWFKVINGFRKQSHALGQAFYRLHRALATGESVQVDSSAETTLGALWKDFYRLAGKAGAPGGSEKVKLDPSPWRKYDEQHAWRTSATSLYVKGHARVKRYERTYRDRRDPSDFVAGLQDLVEKIGVNIAGEAQRIVQNGGREAVEEAVENDKGRGRPVGWARVTDGDACAFCVMLASRGADYGSKRSGELTTEGRKFHPHCGCEAVPVFKGDQLHATVREAQKLWKQSGAGSVSEFREWLDQKNRKGDLHG